METLPLSSSVGWGFPTWDQFEMMSLVKSLGIDLIQIFRNRQLNLAATEIRRGVDGEGLKITSLHAFFGPDFDPSLTSEASRQRSADNLSREADFVLALGGDLVVVHPGCADTGGSSSDADRVAALERSAEQLAGVGERTQVTFALENLPHGQVGDDMAVLRRIVDRIDSPRLALTFDCGHANLTSNAAAVLRQAGPRLATTHIHDNFGVKDEHLPPGSGNVDMETMCRTLAEIKYRGDFGLELMAPVAVLREQLDDTWRKRLRRWVELASGAK
jgi:sugar phosphate isomerase/epimerase